MKHRNTKKTSQGDKTLQAKAKADVGNNARRIFLIRIRKVMEAEARLFGLGPFIDGSIRVPE